MLLERPGDLVSREELRAKLWPAGTLVEYDQGLNAAVNRLREALCDSAEAPQFIETLPKRGYRFIAAVQPQANVLRSAGLPDGAPQSAPAAAAPAIFARQSRSRNKVLFAWAAGFGAILLIAVAINAISHRWVTRVSTGRAVVPLTGLPGEERSPTFSPDGSQIAFARKGGPGTDRQFDLYVKSLGSERLLQLTHRPSRWISPAWSPDGSTIAFAREDQEGGGIFVVPALGGSERTLVSAGLARGSFIQINWSPDGRLLAYSAYGPTGAPQVYVISLDSLSTRPLAPAPKCLAATEPVFSPDGKQIALACLSSTAVYSIYTVGYPGGPLRRLASVTGYPQGLAWAADGERLLFSTDPGDGGELWALRLDGERVQLPFGEDSSAPAFAPHGDRMAYVRGRNNVGIWRADLASEHPEDSAVRLIYSTRSQVLGRYSPDGSHIAFQSNRSGSAEIWMTDAQGADTDRLTSFNGALSSAPSWCSDGRRIAFDSRASGLSSIYVEDINERAPRKVVTSESNLSFPGWSEDCRWLYATDGQGGLYRFASAGGPAVRFTEHTSSYFLVVGDRVIFNVTEPHGVVLWTKPVSGGPEKPLEAMSPLRYDDAWAATRDGIYFTDTSSRPISLNFYEFTTRATRKLMVLQEIPVPGVGPGIAVSADGRWLLYTEAGDEHSEIMLAPAQ
ncbi:MAG: hypothetical protein QOI59_6504 [Gammaproteobacteria bacterium]|jgi:Tol biopolymer transport system component|nr:hypothetical protein [Gammaproteobacteria bacterium]